MSEQPRHEDWCPCSQLIGAPMDDGESAEMGAFAWPADACVCGAVPVVPPLPAGPVAPPPDQFVRDADEIRSAYGFLLMRMAVAKDAQDAYDVAKREFADHEAALKRLEIALGEAPRGAARPPQPTLEQLAQHLGWGAMSAEQAFGFAVKREQLLRVAQTLLETQKSDAPDAEAAIRDRVQTLTAARPPASPPALEALRGATNDLHIAFCELLQLAFDEDLDIALVDALESRADDAMAEIQRALAVPPEAPPP